MTHSQKIEQIFSAVQNAEAAWIDEVQEGDETKVNEPVIYWNDAAPKAGWYWGGDESMANVFQWLPSWTLSELLACGSAEEELISRELGRSGRLDDEGDSYTWHETVQRRR